jgi:Spy/CpxP family protein refolding chaperone
MKKSIVAMLGVGGLAIFFLTALAQPDDKKGPKKGPPGEKKGWEPGKIMPPYMRDGLELTEDQQKKIDDLEKDVREKLLKILTKDQLDRVKEMGDKGPPEKGKGKKGKDKDKNKDPETVEAKVTGAHSGIQWFGTWEIGQREAIATGRPILLVSAAPHCAGVSGTW